MSKNKYLSKIKKLFVVSEQETEQLAQPALTENKKGLSRRLSKTYNWRVELEMKTWRSAVAIAEDPIRPRREDLYRLYHRAIEDNHLLSQIRTAIFTVRTGDFIIMKNNKEDKAKKLLFERPWFRLYLKLAIEAEMWGHSLIEFNPLKIDGEFRKLELVPRIHVRPEYGEVVINVHDEKGLPYRKGAINKYLIEIGDPNDLGLLKVASKVIIRKEYALTDWSRRNEKYGMPFMVIKTASRQKDELDEKQRMAENFGSNGWAILDDQDDIDFKESTNQYAYQAYKEYAESSDKSISILINGQTGTTEEKSYVGSAQVHERILNTYTKDRMQRLQDNINYALIPFLIRHGYPLNFHQFQFKDLLDNDNKKPDNLSKGTEQKLSFKKKSTALSLSIYDHEDHCCDLPNKLAIQIKGLDLDSIVKKAIQKTFRDKQNKGLDSQIWKYNVEALWKAIQEGSGKHFINLEYSDPEFELLAQLKNNIHVFAAFKNHAAIQEMVATLSDGNKLLEWNEYKLKAEAINDKYYIHWLETEYNTAISSAQMATKWMDYQKNKDLLPYLKYITQLDGRVRPGHQALHGTTLPIDHEFWNEFYPPNAWGCRCTVIQLAADNPVPPKSLPSENDAPDIFKNNVGKSKEIFPLTHPFFLAVTNVAQRDRLIKATSRLIYNNYEQPWSKKYLSKNGGYVVAHADHGVAELNVNLKTAKILAKKGEAIELIADHKRKKSPDATRNGLLWEFKTISGNEKTATQNAIKRGKKQAPRILLSFSKLKDINAMTLGIYNAIVINDKKNKITDISIMWDNKVIDLSRSEIEDGTFVNKIKKAMK